MDRTPALSLITVLACAQAPAHAQLAFTDVTAQAGVTVAHANEGNGGRSREMAGGGAIADFNHDGFQDIYFLSGGLEHDRLFINNGDGTFTDRAAAWGIHTMGRHIGVGACPGDFNGDGLIDLYITSQGAPSSSGQIGKHRLLINLGPDDQGQWSFQDFATHCGVNRTATTIADGFGAAAGDYDLDGDLDLAVAGWIPLGTNYLFRNDGPDGANLPIFSDATPNISSPWAGGAGLQNRGFSPRMLDTNGDWYPEIHWVSDFVTSIYLRNNTDGTFTDITASSGTGLDQNGMGVTQGDFDNDGLVDWYVSSIDQPGFMKPREGNRLYMNRGNDLFSETAQAAGADQGAWGWGVSAVDLDHDGDLDIAEANGWFDFKIFAGVPAKLFKNNGDATFVEAAAQHGMDHVSDARGLARLDFDNDGDQDIAIFSHLEPFTLLRNDLITPGNQPQDANWLRVLVDTEARPDLAPHGQGAKITATTASGTQIRHIDIGPTYLVNDELSAHFGLGADASVDVLTVEFHDGTTITYTNLTANQTLDLTLPACRIDYAEPFGVLDLADITAFVNAFLNNEPPADIAPPGGTLDLADLTAFIALFMSNCGP